MFDLKNAKMPPKTFVSLLENALSATLADVGVNAVSRPDRVGLWVVTPDGGEEKIAALGIRIRHGVSYHGISVNVCPDLSVFDGIIPCGLSGYGVMSLQKLGIETTDVGMLDRPFADHFSRLFRTKTFFADSP